MCYRPKIVLNCCAAALQAELTDFIYNNFLRTAGPGISLFESEHPSVHWSSSHKEKEGIPVYHVSLPDRIWSIR